jgi:hypothetical protein
LRIVQVAGMQIEIVGVKRRLGEARPDDEFNAVALGARLELDQRVLVQAKLLLHAL